MYTKKKIYLPQNSRKNRDDRAANTNKTVFKLPYNKEKYFFLFLKIHSINILQAYYFSEK